MKKRILSIALSLFVAIGLAGCGGVQMDSGAQPPAAEETAEGEEAAATVATEASGPRNGSTYRIAFFLPNVGPWYDEKWYAAEAKAKELGYEITLFSAGGYSNVDKQVQQVSDAITAEYDGIIIHSCSSSALIPVLKEAQAAGIKVMTTHVPLEEKICPHMWEDPYAAGQDLAIELANEIGGEGKVFMMNGPAGQLEAQECQFGFEYIMQTYFPQIEITEEYVDQELSTAQKVAEDYLTANPDAKGVYCFGATSAAGGMVAALKSAGKNPGDVKLVATNGVEDDLHYVSEGWVQWIQPSCHILVGQQSVETMGKMFNGESVDMDASVQMVSVTASTVDVFNREYFIWTGDTEDTSALTQ